MSDPLPLRAVRVDDATWTAAMDRARREDRPLSGVIRAALRDYAAGTYTPVDEPVDVPPD